MADSNSPPTTIDSVREWAHRQLLSIEELLDADGLAIISPIMFGLEHRVKVAVESRQGRRPALFSMEQGDWLTVGQVWHHVREHFDSGYTLERREDDLRALVGWQNLMAEQDRSGVSTLDEWHHRRQVYHITAVTIELEVALERLRAVASNGKTESRALGP